MWAAEQDNTVSRIVIVVTAHQSIGVVVQICLEHGRWHVCDCILQLLVLVVIIIGHLLVLLVVLRVLDGHLGQDILLRRCSEGGALLLLVHQGIRWWWMEHHLLVPRMIVVSGRRRCGQIVTAVRVCRLIRSQIDVLRWSRINVPWGYREERNGKANRNNN